MSEPLSTRTSVSIGLLIVVLAWVALDVRWKASVDYHLQQVRSDVARLASDRWSRSDQRNWRDRLETLNEGTLRVPPLPHQGVAISP